MASSGPLGPDDPFGQMGPFGDMFRMLSQQQGGSTWDVARQVAASVATDGTPEANVDPVDRIQFEQLARVAELHVANATGLQPSHFGNGIQIATINRTQWVQRSTEAYKDLLEVLAGSLAQPPAEDDGPADPFGDPGGDPLAQMLGPLMEALRPALVGMTAGSMLGHLAKRSFGQYDLPLPRPTSDELAVVVPNLDAFGEEWSLPRDDLRMWVCLFEVTNHAIVQLPHVRTRLHGLLHDYVGGFRTDAGALGTQLESMSIEPDAGDPMGLGQIQRFMSDPEVLLGAMRSPAQLALLPQVEALVTAIVGYVDWVMDTVGSGLIGSYRMLTEALRRRRVEANPSNRFVEKLLGVELTQDRYDAGQRFVAGVVERAGSAGLARLWESDRTLPTPADIEAPGLWLARLEFES